MKRIPIAYYQLEEFKRSAKRVAHEMKVVSEGAIIFERHHLRLDALAWVCGYKDYPELVVVSRTITTSEDGGLCLADADEKRALLRQRWFENPFVALQPSHIEHLIEKLDWKNRRDQKFHTRDNNTKVDFL